MCLLMLKIIFLAISLYLLFKIFKKRKTKKSVGKTDFSKAISNWKHDEGKDIKQEPLYSYSSRHESTPNSEKAAEEIVTKHEKITRDLKDYFKVKKTRDKSKLDWFVSNTGDNCYIRGVLKKKA